MVVAFLVGGRSACRSCPRRCTASRLRAGHGNVDGGEQCDDGNFIPGGGYRADCTVETPVDPCTALCAQPGALHICPDKQVLVGTRGNDVLCGFGGDDRLFGDGDDVLIGGASTTYRTAVRATTRSMGGGANDVLNGHRGVDTGMNAKKLRSCG